MEKIKCLGIDTSNYTTSVCTYDGTDIDSQRRIIPVKHGMRGIRQSEGVFEHVRELPNLYDKLDVENIRAVGVSTVPRNETGSYMPVFLAGTAFARGVAKTAGVPLYEFSHQDGHIAAGILSARAYDFLDGEFLALHISGGTTEILRCRFNGCNFDVKIVGGTLDISAGQLIDRAGVHMGCGFPAGREVERLSEQCGEHIAFPISVKGSYINFSGAENKARDLIDKGQKSDAAYAVLTTVSNSIARALSNAVKTEGINRIMAVGGVMSNSLIRKSLKTFGAYFASPELSSDNAAGIAYLTYLNAENKK